MTPLDILGTLFAVAAAFFTVILVPLSIISVGYVAGRLGLFQTTIAKYADDTDDEPHTDVETMRDRLADDERRDRDGCPNCAGQGVYQVGAVHPADPPLGEMKCRECGYEYLKSLHAIENQQEAPSR